MSEAKKKTIPSVTSMSATSMSAPSPKKPSVAAPPKPRKAKPRYVRLRNMLAQTLNCSVVNDSGKAEELRLAGRSTSGPVREDRLTEHTKTLVHKGHLRVGG